MLKKEPPRSDRILGGASIQNQSRIDYLIGAEQIMRGNAQGKGRGAVSWHRRRKGQESSARVLVIQQ